MNELQTWRIKDSNKYYDLRIFSVVFVVNRVGAQCVACVDGIRGAWYLKHVYNIIAMYRVCL